MSEGGWVKVVPPECKCWKPAVSRGSYGDGSQWKCKCGQVWQLRWTENYRGDSEPSWAKVNVDLSDL